MKLAVILPLLTLCLLRPLAPAAASPGPACLPTPLPSDPGGNPSFSMNIQYGQDRMGVTLWRQPCQDSQDVVLLLRATPVSISSFFCPNRWYLDQAASRFSVSFLPSMASLLEGAAPSLCEIISAPATVIVAASTLAAGEPGTFEAKDDFVLLYYGASDEGTKYIVYKLEIPDFQAVQPPPPVPSPPTITVVPTHCSPCRSGETAGFEGRVNNPGPARQGEIKAGARLPDGSILPFFNQVVMLASGPTVLTLVPAQTLPAGLTTMDLLVEAAILEPTLGETLSRHNVPLHLMP